MQHAESPAPVAAHSGAKRSGCRHGTEDMAKTNKRLPAAAHGDDNAVAGMKEIAERVGVSKTTVHRALTGNGRISEKTRARILAVASELDYTPNTVARSLRRQRTGTLGVVTNGVSNSFYATLLAAIEEAASSQGFSLLLCCSSGSAELEMSHLGLLKEKRVDGLLVAPSSQTGNVEEYERLKRGNLPFVFMDRVVPAVSADAVMTDHRLAGQLVAEHLIAGGRRRIGLLMPLDESSISTSVQERVLGIYDVAAHSGTEVIRIGRERYWDPMEDYGAFALSSFLDDGGEVDSVFGINDHVALGAMYACLTRGIRVPDQIAVVGYDDLDISSFVTPRLTTVRQPTRQIAWEAVKMLLSRIGGARPDEAVTVRLRPILMERESTPKVRRAAVPPPSDQ